MTMLSPLEIVQNRMLDNDAYSQWLGISLEVVQLGSCELQMTVRNEMLNGFKIGHGSITFALADSAMAFAANTYGYHAVSIETSISHIKPIRGGDVLVAKTVEKSRTRTIGIYEVSIYNQESSLVALFKGTVFIKKSMWT